MAPIAPHGRGCARSRRASGRYARSAGWEELSHYLIEETLQIANAA
jgi:hypothetical protein